jgi:hypothetical protein
VSYQTIEVNLLGTVDRSTVSSGEIAKFDIAPAQSEIGGFSVGVVEIEWQFTPDNPDDGSAYNPGCSGNRHCEMYVNVSGTMRAQAYTNGKLKDSPGMHVATSDQLMLTVDRDYGPTGYRAVFKAFNSDSTPILIDNWTFIPDSGQAPIVVPCPTWTQGVVWTCAMDVPTSGTMKIKASVHYGHWAYRTKHVRVIPCPTGDSLLDTPVLRDGMSLLQQLSHFGNSQRGTEHGGWLYRNPNTGEYIFVEYVSIQDACSFAVPESEGDYDPLREWRVALVHSHPFGKGEPFDGRCVSTNNKPGRGDDQGPSPHDDAAANDYAVPSYVIDKDSLYRTRGPGLHQSWPRSQNGCQIVPPPDPTLDRVRKTGPALRDKRAGDHLTGAR